MELSQSHCACWQTFSLSLYDLSMETRWGAALPLLNPTIHLCGIHAHRFTPAHSLHLKAQMSMCCTFRPLNHKLHAQVIAIVRTDLCYSIRHAHHLCSNDSVTPLPLLSEVMIPVAYWCYFYVPAKSIDGICSFQTTKTQTFLPVGFTEQNSHKQDPSSPTLPACQSKTRR